MIQNLVFHKHFSHRLDLLGSQYHCCIELVPGLENLDLFIGVRCDYLVCLWKSFHKRFDGNQCLLKAVYYTGVVHNFDLQEKTTSTLKKYQTLLKNLRRILKKKIVLSENYFI